jgi:uncharacterized protein YlxW (UPF0749 family)
MQNWRARILVSAVCLILGFLMVPQFRSQRIDRTVLAQSPNDQASYISQLYASNQRQRANLEQLQAEIGRYQETTNGGSSIVSLIKDLQQMRMANGEVDLTGPGVTVRVTGAQNPAQVVQDLVNELRASAAEAIAVNGVRLTTRSVIAADENQQLQVDKQPISEPYLLDAIGDPATLQNALERKGGVIALLQQDPTEKIVIKVTHHTETADWIKMPKTALDLKWRYAQAVPGN